MAVSIVEPIADRPDYGTRKIDERSGIVVVEGANPSEVTSMEARKLASAKGSELGINRPGLGLASGAYRVDEKGEEIKDRRVVANSKYRCDYPINGGL